MNKKVRQKLNEILDMKTVIDDKRLYETEISDFESAHGIQLPKEYKDFLMNFPEVYVNDDYKFPMVEKSDLTSESGFENIDFLYVGNFISNAEKFIKEYGTKLLPIGETAGDTICMGIQGNMNGKIYFIYHEDENKDEYLAANSFNEFILGFEKRESHGIDLDEIEIELDDDLWNS